MSNDGKLRTLPHHNWPVSEWAIARITVRLPIIADASGLALHGWVDPGLGPATGCAFRLASGVVVLLEELEHRISHFHDRGPQVYADAGDVDALGIDKILDETLLALGLKASDVEFKLPPPAEGEVAQMRVVVERGQRHRAEFAATLKQETRWVAVEEHAEQLALQAELRAELHEDHPLFGQLDYAAPLARRYDRDDVLFVLYGGRVAEVHLTWRSGKEEDPRWPTTTFFDSAAEWLAARKETSEDDVR